LVHRVELPVSFCVDLIFVDLIFFSFCFFRF